jgi:hypothetical protein
VTVDVEVPEIRIATRMQPHPQEATGTTHLEEGIETWMGRLSKETRTASVIRTADMTDPDARAAEALNTTTTAERDCKTARRTFMRGRCFASKSESVLQGGKHCRLAMAVTVADTKGCCTNSRHEARH